MLEVHSELSASGYRLQIGTLKTTGVFRRSVTFEPVADWASGLEELNPLAAAVVDELSQQQRLVRVNDAVMHLDFVWAAELHNVDAETLHLPPPFPYQLEINSRGTLGTAAFQLSYHATDGGVRVPGHFSQGVFSVGDRRFRLAGLLFNIVTIIDALNAETGAEAKISRFAALRLLLPDDNTDTNIHSESFLLRIRVAHITAISLTPAIKDGNVTFDPVPMRRKDPEDHSLGAEFAITPAASGIFASEFRGQRTVNSTYALASGEYIYVDPSIRTALRVVKQKQSAPLEERMAFLMSPAIAITQAYRAEGLDGDEVPIGDTVFFETAEYSERISGIGEWVPPQLSYLEREQNNWLPERFSIVLSGKLITGQPEDIPNWIEQVKGALASNKSDVTLGGVNIPTNTPNLLAMLQRLQPAEAMPKIEEAKDDKGTERPRRRINIFQTKSNFDRSEYKRQFKERRLGDRSLPTMRAILKTHQEVGVQWLANCYLAGWPGVLLADDMGLGKTLQSLSFLVLLRREGIIRKGRPALVVAPTSLLRNWRDEHKRHTLGEGLGEPLTAFGTQLRSLRIGKAEKDDVVLLDTNELAKSNWVLTTYETLRDYHMSFARVPFSVAILDEIQKAKNPITRINATLKALNIDFVLSMTGTPVETSSSNLTIYEHHCSWILLILSKDFMRTYGKTLEVEARQEALEQLSAELLKESEVDGRRVPPYVLRRLKEDVAKDLPHKYQGPMVRAEMPSMQAQRYAEVSTATQAKQVKLLRALHDFRSISLHPVDPDIVNWRLDQRRRIYCDVRTISACIRQASACHRQK